MGVAVILEPLLSHLKETLPRRERGTSFPRLSKSGNPPRQLAFDLAGAPASANPMAQLTFQDGDYQEAKIHQLIDRWLWTTSGRKIFYPPLTVRSAWGSLVKRHRWPSRGAVSLSVTLGNGEQVGVLGHIDGLFVSPDGDGELWEPNAVTLLEIKSAADYSFWQIKSIKALREDPFMGRYFDQIQSYMGSDELTSLGVTQALLLIVNKNTGRTFKEFVITRDDERIEYIRRKFGVLLSRDRPPEAWPQCAPFKSKTKTHYLLSPVCSYCDFHTTCYGRVDVLGYNQRGAPQHGVPAWGPPEVTLPPKWRTAK